jgi:hypothetical protein
MGTILENEFPERDIDLVIDDASHFYEETKAAFNIVFPFLRPGGLYVIEDWSWAHWQGEWQESENHFADKRPLTNLIFELTMACPSQPDIISDVSITRAMAFIKRGRGNLNREEFDISDLYLTRGKPFKPIL